MTIDGMGATSLAYHNECKERRENTQETKENETLILLLEEENAVEAV